MELSGFCPRGKGTWAQSLWHVGDALPACPTPAPASRGVTVLSGAARASHRPSKKARTPPPTSSKGPCAKGKERYTSAHATSYTGSAICPFFPTLPQTPAVLWSLGATMGAVTAALAGWRPPGLGGGWEDQEQARDQGQGGVPGSSPGDGSAPSGNPAGGSGCAAIGAAVGAGGGEGDGDLSDWHVDRAAAVVQRLVPSIGAFSVEQRWVVPYMGSGGAING